MVTCAGIVVTLIVSFLISNAVAIWMETSRKKRIATKAFEMCKESTLKTPVTIVTGFLGSGKTTFVNRILGSEEVEKRLAVIENEVGAVSIDDKLLRPGLQERADVGIYVLKNGCICCLGGGGTGDAELERVLNHILELRKEESYDHVLIETSGLADPAPLMQMFFSYRPFPSGSFRQIALASTIVINKVDTLRPGLDPPLSELRAALALVNPEAAVLEAVEGRVALGPLLAQRAFESAASMRPRGLPGDEAGAAQRAPPWAAKHGRGVTAVTLKAERPVDLAAVHRWISCLVLGEDGQGLGDDLYRIKAVLDVQGSDKVYVMQGVCGELKGQYCGVWEAQDRRESSMVLIGRGLHRDSLRAAFLACQAA